MLPCYAVYTHNTRHRHDLVRLVYGRTNKSITQHTRIIGVITSHLPARLRGQNSRKDRGYAGQRSLRGLRGCRAQRSAADAVGVVMAQTQEAWSRKRITGALLMDAAATFPSCRSWIPTAKDAKHGAGREPHGLG